MKPFNVIIDEIKTHIENKNINAIISVIRDALEPFDQKKQLKQALLLLRVDVRANTIFNYSFMVNSKELREILINNELIPTNFYTRKNAKSTSPLALAVEYGDCEYVENALKNGANVNELSGTDNLSLLEIASDTLNLDMVKLLIRYGADVIRYGAGCIFHALNHDGRTAADSNKHNQKEIVELLIQNGANVLKTYGKKKCLVNDLLMSCIDEFNNPDATVLLNKEIYDRNQLNYTIPLIFWASKHDEGSSVYGMPEEIIQNVALITRNKKR